MTIHPSFRYKLALMVSLVIHIITIVFIALQIDRALPMLEGVETITLSLGGPMKFQGSSGLASHKGGISEQISKPEPVSQKKSANKAQPNKAKTPPKSESIPINTLVDDTIESPLLAQKTKVMEKPKPIKPAHKPEQETQNQLVADSPQKTAESQLIVKPPHQITWPSSQDKAQVMPSNSPAKNSSSSSSSLASEDSPSGQGMNALSGNSQFAANGDGSYTALGSSGISYTILQDANPKYPKEARSLGYTKVVKVQIRLLVGLNGQVESVEILNSKIPDLGFKEEAVKAIKKMAFKPIIYQGQNVKMYFKKTVVFQY